MEKGLHNIWYHIKLILLSKPYSDDIQMKFPEKNFSRFSDSDELLLEI
jgi:hypothetical protein